VPFAPSNLLISLESLGSNSTLSASILLILIRLDDGFRINVEAQVAEALFEGSKEKCLAFLRKLVS
jgi:hypothetical protein